jgi:prevent-host-death family protein
MTIMDIEVMVLEEARSMTRSASIAEAKSRLSSLVNQVAHGRRRIVLTSRGRSKAALVGLDDLAALEDLSPTSVPDDSVLDEIDLFKQQILHQRRGVLLSDSLEDIAALREGER